MKNLSIFPILLFTFALSAQEPITISHGCNFEGDENGSEYYSFDPSGEATRIVKQILDAAGALSYSSIIVKESNIKNALATTVDKRRYILYSITFLEKFKGDAKTRWAANTILAHEIGHHLNGHDFAEKDPKERKRMELEADKFAGAVCRTLGATLDEALAGMESMQLEGETATHPAKSARTAAIANGWKKQDELLEYQSSNSKVVTDNVAKPSTQDPLPQDACPNCYGEGTIANKIECEMCKGSGLITMTEKCQKCNGLGKIFDKKCWHCEGHGYSICSSCDGTGKKKDVACSFCKGTGKWAGLDNPGKCIFCDGTGNKYNTCFNCSSKGVINIGKTKCSCCDGIGRLDERSLCTVCKGTGKKKDP